MPPVRIGTKVTHHCPGGKGNCDFQKYNNVPFCAEHQAVCMKRKSYAGMKGRTCMKCYKADIEVEKRNRKVADLEAAKKGSEKEPAKKERKAGKLRWNDQSQFAAGQA